MEFKKFRELMVGHIDRMIEGVSHLYRANTVKEEMWNLYLDSFPPGTNEIFRERREFDCNCCKGFISNFGNVVKIRGGEVTTIWDFETGSDKYQTVVNALSRYVRESGIRGVFLPDRKEYGVKETMDVSVGRSTLKWSHFHYKVPKDLIVCRPDQVHEKESELHDTRNVLKRSVTEIKTEAVGTVLDLIGQGSLYKGEEWKEALETLKRLQGIFSEVDGTHQELFFWETSVRVGPAVGKIRNHSIGVLLKDLTDGVELDTAVTRYERIVAPTNYKRPKAVFSKAMVRKAQETVAELGLEGALGRRYARVDDLTLNDVLFANRESRLAMESPFDELAKEAQAGNGDFSKVEEISVDRFLGEVVPTATEIEVLVEGRHEGNFVSLIAPENKDGGSLFKWDNAFSWAYSGNIADSMKGRVKAEGGRVDGALRFSIQWNENDDNKDDLDAHCLEPSGNRIFFENKRHVHESSGMLDVDIIDPVGVAVENIIWTNRRRMQAGRYQMIVDCYASRSARSGFSAEIECNGEIHEFHYAKPLRHKQKVHVADVEAKPGGELVVKGLLDSTQQSREIWGVRTNEFHPVSVLTLSPNFWEGSSMIGHRHHFFMLKGCRNETTPNGFFNEHLKQELLKHKRVFEALGSKMAVAKSDEQLSGLGFSATKKDNVVCRVKGSFTRTLRVVF